MNNVKLDISNMPDLLGIPDLKNSIQQTTTTTTTTTTENAPVDLKQFGMEQNLSTSTNQQQDYSKYFQTTSEPLDLKALGFDLKSLGLEDNTASTSNLQQTTTTTTTTTKTTGSTESQNANLGMEQNVSQTPASGAEDYSKYFQTTPSEPFDLKALGFGDNTASTSNLQQTTTTTTTTTKTTGSTESQNVNLGMEQNVSQTLATGAEDYSKYFQTTSEPLDLKALGLEDNTASASNLQQTTTTTTTTTKTTGNAGMEQNASQTPATGAGDYSKYFQETKTTTTKTTGNVNLNDLASKGLSTNFGIPSSSSSNAVSYANAQSSSSSYNTYGATKTTFTKETKSYVGPTQSYSYQYSYNMPATGSTTVTKTTYTGVAPGTSPK
jgi:type VI secretion system secreted protein VgrG